MSWLEDLMRSSKSAQTRRLRLGRDTTFGAEFEPLKLPRCCHRVFGPDGDKLVPSDPLGESYCILLRTTWGDIQILN